jgi:hypothetical protein
MSAIRALAFVGSLLGAAWAGPAERLPTNPEDAERTLFVVEALRGSAIHTRRSQRARIAGFVRGEVPVGVLDGDGFWLTPGSEADVRWLLAKEDGRALRDRDMVLDTLRPGMAPEGTIWIRNRRALSKAELLVVRPLLRVAQSSRQAPMGVAIVHPAPGSVALTDDIALYVPRLREGDVVKWRATPASGPAIVTVSRVDGNGFLQGPRPRLAPGKVRIELISGPGSSIDRRPVTLTLLDGEAALRLRAGLGQLGSALLQRPSAERTLALCRALAQLDRAPAYAIRALSWRVALVPEDVEARTLLEYARSL